MYYMYYVCRLSFNSSRSFPLRTRQNDIKTIGRCKACRSPLKFVNTQVKCEFIRQFRTARRRIAIPSRFRAVSRLREMEKRPFLRRRGGELGCMPREGLA